MDVLPFVGPMVIALLIVFVLAALAAGIVLLPRLRLGEVTKATAEMIDRAKDLGRLEQALRPPKARGGFGELLLENLLRDRLPPDAYDLQYTFSGGERVDAVIYTEQLVPIDAKFPLDNF